MFELTYICVKWIKYSRNVYMYVGNDIYMCVKLCKYVGNG